MKTRVSGDLVVRGLRDLSDQEMQERVWPCEGREIGSLASVVEDLFEVSGLDLALAGRTVEARFVFSDGFEPPRLAALPPALVTGLASLQEETATLVGVSPSVLLKRPALDRVRELAAHLLDALLAVRSGARSSG